LDAIAMTNASRLEKLKVTIDDKRVRIWYVDFNSGADVGILLFEQGLNLTGDETSSAVLTKCLSVLLRDSTWARS
jgi:hypothetical protein